MMIQKAVFTLIGLAVAAVAPLPAVAQSGDDCAGRVAGRTAVYAQIQEWGKDRSTGLSTFFYECEGRELLFLGSTHTFDPASPSIAAIERYITLFAPTRVLIEGGNWPVAPDRRSAVPHYGELGWTRFLADAIHAEVRPLDPPFEQQVAHAARFHPAEAVKLYFTARMIPQWRKQTTGKTLAELTAEFSARFPAVGGVSLATRPSNIDELADMLTPHLAPGASWRDLDFNLTIKSSPVPVLVALDKTVNDYRNRAMADAVLAALEEGHRVLVMAGHTHLRATMPALDAGIKRMVAQP